MTWLDLFTLGAYLSLVAELLFLPVPSVASSYQLARGEPGYASDDRESREHGAHTARWLRYFGPAALNVAVFLLPLVSIVIAPDISLWKRMDLSPPSILVVVGCLAVVGGRALTIAAALDMRRLQNHALLRGGLDQPLQTKGLFKRSRNPGLCGMYLFAGGLLLLYPNELYIMGLVHYLWHMHQRVRIEETVLQRQFSDSYRAYCANTPRYL